MIKKIKKAARKPVMIYRDLNEKGIALYTDPIRTAECLTIAAAEQDPWHFGTTLRYLLGARDISISFLITKIGISRYRIEQLLSLKKSPRLDDLKKLLDYLGLKIDMKITQLIKDTNEPK